MTTANDPDHEHADEPDDDGNEDGLRALPAEVVEALETVERRIEARLQAEFFAGPLPPPEMLRAYDGVVENGAERLFRQFEREGDHRRDIESKRLVADIARSKQGLWIGSFIVFVMIVGSIILVLRDHDWAGTALGGTTLASVTATYIIGTRIQARSLDPAEDPDSD